MLIINWLSCSLQSSWVCFILITYDTCLLIIKLGNSLEILHVLADNVHLRAKFLKICKKISTEFFVVIHDDEVLLPTDFQKILHNSSSMPLRDLRRRTFTKHTACGRRSPKTRAEDKTSYSVSVKNVEVKKLWNFFVFNCGIFFITTLNKTNVLKARAQRWDLSCSLLYTESRNRMLATASPHQKI